MEKVIKHWTEYKYMQKFRCYNCKCEFESKDWYKDKYTSSKIDVCPECSSKDLEEIN